MRTLLVYPSRGRRPAADARMHRRHGRRVLALWPSGKRGYRCDRSFRSPIPQPARGDARAAGRQLARTHRSSIGAKVITVFPGNDATPLDSHLGVVLLFEADSGRLLAIIDASSVTAIRTAAVSGVATRAAVAPGRGRPRHPRRRRAGDDAPRGDARRAHASAAFASGAGRRNARGAIRRKGAAEVRRRRRAVGIAPRLCATAPTSSAR